MTSTQHRTISRAQLYAAGEPLGDGATRAKPGGHGRIYGFGGGGGSSHSDNTTTNSDSRISQQSGVATSGNNNSITVTDGGAVKAAFDFASNSNKQVLDSLNEVSGVVANAYNDAKGRGALADWITIGAIAIAGLVAVAALKR